MNPKIRSTLLIAGVLALAAVCSAQIFPAGLPGTVRLTSGVFAVQTNGTQPTILADGSTNANAPALGPFNAEAHIGFVVGATTTVTNSGGVAPSAGTYTVAFNKSSDGTTNTMEKVPTFSATMTVTTNGAALNNTNIDITIGTATYLIPTVSSNNVPVTNLCQVTPNVWYTIKPGY